MELSPYEAGFKFQIGKYIFRIDELLSIDLSPINVSAISRRAKTNLKHNKNDISMYVYRDKGRKEHTILNETISDLDVSNNEPIEVSVEIAGSK